MMSREVADDDSRVVVLLADIRDFFAAAGTTRILSADLVEARVNDYMRIAGWRSRSCRATCLTSGA
jgi:hypothetical protein